MKRSRQEFYLQLKGTLWQAIKVEGSDKALKRQEEEIYLDALMRLRSLEHKLEKEYKKFVAKEEETFIKERIGN